MHPYTGDLLWVGFSFFLGDNYSRGYFALVFEVDELDAQVTPGLTVVLDESPYDRWQGTPMLGFRWATSLC
jgi:hypothetical protein